MDSRTSFLGFLVGPALALSVVVACGEDEGRERDSDGGEGGESGESGSSTSGGSGGSRAGSAGGVAKGGSAGSSGNGVGGSSMGKGGTTTAGSLGDAGSVGGTQPAAGGEGGESASGNEGGAGTSGDGGTTSGDAGSGGVTGGSAGSAGSGGASGTGGGGPGECAAWEVANDGYVTAPGASASCWNGYASAFADYANINRTTFSTCGEDCRLCVSGTLEASTVAIALVGFNVNQAAGSSTIGTVTPTGSALVVSFTSQVTTPLRVVLSSGGSHWCATVTTSPATIPYAEFNTQCWDPGGSGSSYARQPFTFVSLRAEGVDAGSRDYSMCLTGVSDQ